METGTKENTEILKTIQTQLALLQAKDNVQPVNKMVTDMATLQIEYLGQMVEMLKVQFAEVNNRINIIQKDNLTDLMLSKIEQEQETWDNLRNLKTLCFIPNLRKLLRLKTFFGHPYGVVIAKEVKMGTNCLIYQNVTIDKSIEDNRDKPDYPVIGNNVTICASSVITGKVKVGDNVTIGANSVVTTDIEDNCVVAGNPAKLIKKIGVSNGN